MKNPTPESTPLTSRLNRYRHASATSKPSAKTTVAAAASWGAILAIAPSASASSHSINFSNSGPSGSVNFQIPRESFGYIQATINFNAVIGSGGSGYGIANGFANKVGSVAGPAVFQFGAAVSYSAVISPGLFTSGAGNTVNYTFNPGGAPKTFFPFEIAFFGSWHGWIQFGSLTGAVNPTSGASITTPSAMAAVPEPSTAIPLLLMGAAGVALNRKRKMRAA